MDLRTSAQDVIRCDLCDKDTTTMYCDFCHVNLCISCIGKHISDDYDKHKVVIIEQRKSTLIYPECTNHQTKRCEFYCKDCKISVCSLCTTLSETHKGHTVTTLFDLYSLKRKVIAKDSEIIDNIISPTFEGIAAELGTQIAKLEGEYDKLLKAVSNEGEEWHRQINIIIDKMKAEIEGIKIKHRRIMKAHLDEIKAIQNLIKHTQVKLNEVEESNEVSKTMGYSSETKELSELPPKVTVSLPKFISNTIKTEELNKLFGSLTPLSLTIFENGYNLNNSKKTTNELLTEPKLITTINTGCGKLHSVNCHSKEEIWTSGRHTSNFKCFNSQGSLIKTIEAKSKLRFRDIAVGSDGEVVYTDLDGTARTVNKEKNGHTEEVIRLQGWVPANIYVTSSGDLLATMYSDDKTQSKVVRYSNFTEKQTIQFDKNGKPLYSGNEKIKYITENGNLDICVADSEARAVVFVNQTGQLRFRYTGHPSSSKNVPFEPFGITTDSQSQILTSDFNNHCIHVLHKDGDFLCYIDNCDLKNPYGLCVDNNNDLFVAEYYTGNVKKIKYLE